MAKNICLVDKKKKFEFHSYFCFYSTVHTETIIFFICTEKEKCWQKLKTKKKKENFNDMFEIINAVNSLTSAKIIFVNHFNQINASKVFHQKLFFMKENKIKSKSTNKWLSMCCEWNWKSIEKKNWLKSYIA